MKKRILALLLAVLAVGTAFAGCSKKDADSDLVKEIANEPAKWVVTSDINYKDCSYAVTDLDQNGKLEIIAEYAIADTYLHATDFFVVDKENGTVVQCQHETAGREFTSAYREEYIYYGDVCYYNPETGEYFYTYRRTTPVTKTERYDQVIGFSLNGTVVKEELIATKTEINNGDDEYEYTYTDAQGNAIDAATYEKAVANRYSGLQEKKVSFGGFEGLSKEKNEELMKMTATQLEEFLLKSYNGFKVG